MNNKHYEHGYKVGWRELPKALTYGNNELEYKWYCQGYEKGKADKEFCDAFWDENLDIHGGFDG